MPHSETAPGSGFNLTPLHALIGPNDSGKSTVLRALRTLAQFAAGHFGNDANTGPVPFDPMLDMVAGCTRMTASPIWGGNCRARQCEAPP